jgi:molybdopterin/thiamine biosynthesis adenylyltransferase
VALADIVLDCCDNFATRHAVNRACVKFRKPLVSGAAIRFDGQVAVFDSRQANAPCYHCLFPEGQDVEEVRCAVMGVFAPLTGIIGTVQAAEALKLMIGCGTSLAGRLLLLDGLGMEWREIKVPRDPACQVCGALLRKSCRCRMRPGAWLSAHGVRHQDSQNSACCPGSHDHRRPPAASLSSMATPLTCRK